MGKNESKMLTKHISCKCRCKCDGIKYNSNKKWNNNRCSCEWKKYHLYQKDFIWNSATCICENGKYVVSVIDNSVIMWMKF